MISMFENSYYHNKPLCSDVYKEFFLKGYENNSHLKMNYCADHFQEYMWYDRYGFFSIEFNLENLKTKMINAFQSSKTDEVKIPKILHSVWFTDPKNPQEILSLEILVNNILELKNINESWSFKFWTNDKNLIPESVAVLEDLGVEIQEIDKFQDVFPLIDLIRLKLTQLDFAHASDLARYQIISNFGGVYADIDYKFINSGKLDKITQRYNFFKPDISAFVSFFAASQNHPIFTHLITDLHKRFNPHESDQDYLDGSNLCNAFYTSIVRYLNIDDNLDVIMPGHCLKFNHDEPCGTKNYDSEFCLSCTVNEFSVTGGYSIDFCITDKTFIIGWDVKHYNGWYDDLM